VGVISFLFGDRAFVLDHVASPLLDEAVVAQDASHGGAGAPRRVLTTGAVTGDDRAGLAGSVEPPNLAVPASAV
jgi:hypothetical protein